MSKQASDNDYDSPWKEALEAYFPQFMQLLFTKAHTEIDWTKPHEFLDTELQKIVRDADSGRKHTDKLVKVYLKSGELIWVLIHIEIQGKTDAAFNERMYRYHYRLLDRYPKRKIASFAVLTNQQNCKSLGCYQQQLWKTQLKFDFPVLNLQSWRDKIEELENCNNPFSLVILAQLIAHNAENNQQKLNRKFQLIRLLYRRGYQRQQILDLLRFIDWMILLPKELELQLRYEITRIEEEEKMAYVTSFERLAKEEGEALGETKGEIRGEIRGEIKGEAQTLLKLFKLKFGSISQSIEDKVNNAEKAQLDQWVEKILTADSIESLFSSD
ncbi:MAG: hypothetical protein GQ569_08225 [Methylococcaceae bacterium]|nr:hypothetical protein [Methylococcaceae bacterium]